MRGLIDHKGEQFGYLQGDQLYTLDGELSGFLREDYVVDLAGGRVWRVFGDGVYKLDSFEQVGFFTSDKPDGYV
jgi:hypothetical protein